MKGLKSLPADHNELLGKFSTDGLLVLPELLPMTHVTMLNELVHALPARLGPGSRSLPRLDSAPDGGTSYLLKVENFSDDVPDIQELVLQAPLAALLEQLLGSAAVLLEDKCVYKPPGSTGFGAHQNMTWYGWAYFVPQAITVLVALERCGSDNGQVEFALGQHARGMIGTMLKKDGLDTLTYQGIDLAPGSVVVFDGYLPHRSQPNHAAHGRCTLSLSYNGAHHGDQRAHYFSFRPRLERHLMLKRFHRAFVARHHAAGGTN